MSALAHRLLENQARKLTAESRRLRNQADAFPSERIANFLRRRSWTLTFHAVKIMQTLGDL
jgi:hypothetical protein